MSVRASVAIGEEQVLDWQRRGVTIAAAALSLGRRPPATWEVLTYIVAAEHAKAVRLLSARRPGVRD